jgi:pyruvate dehydrogenase (quinone)
VLEAITDPEVPPLPPHITLQQAKAFMSAMAHGDPDRGRAITESLKQKIEEFVPGR